jgi:hypothetical protein
MKFLHKLFAKLIGDKDLPDFFEEKGKPVWAATLAGIRAKHEADGTLEKFHDVLKKAYHGLKGLEQFVIDTPNEYDNAGFDIFYEPIRDILIADNIPL